MGTIFPLCPKVNLKQLHWWNATDGYSKCNYVLFKDDLFLTTFLGGISLWLHSSLWIMNHDIYPCANCCYFDFTDLNQLVSLESLILDHNIELHLLPATLLKMENLKMIGLSWYVFFNCFQLLLLWLTEKIFVCTLTQGGGVESAHADCNWFFSIFK